MSRSWKTTVLGSLAVAGVVSMTGVSYGVSYGAEGPAVAAVISVGPSGPDGSVGSSGPDLWAAATIEPGREGRVEVGGYEGMGLGEGSTLTLTAPTGTRVTGMPFASLGYRGAVGQGGATGTYTFTGASGASGAAGEPAPAGGDPGSASDSPSEAWKRRTFPFVLSVGPEAEPGTRLPDCALVLRDAKGTVRERGTCTVTVGLPVPTLSRPQSGVPVDALSRTVGTAYPGAQITVRDAAENEVCSTTAGPNGIWHCVPALALTPGPGRLQATATMNGVSSTSEQIDITVSGAPEAQATDSRKSRRPQ
ncbi:carboxypeptidase regulatory-like domain-containing protein [Streptomyces cyaneochromogenes]|uniref:Carboxypeptidase regulatory-like domain-containing protein n=1 Tax=Streptomyces cyaneochromogenes TaxID=2496836 RepID=A0A3S9MAD6_9ACTN|nr:carboxypeptidase regulatory-like domain-containing protein [Streptomyces cyaneochromogenes]AZQ36167.1 carboxypeptidase regulatory-like domain-containing protein [Streptomyces cyaneochromogenes]